MTSTSKRRIVGFASSCVEETGITVERSTTDSRVFNVDIGFVKVNRRWGTVTDRIYFFVLHE